MTALLTVPADVWAHNPVATFYRRPTPSLRFDTVRDLYGAFAPAGEDVGVPISDEPSLGFIESAIENETWSAGLSFCAYLLPRREAVWWGAQSLRRMMPKVPGIEALEAAEAWVRNPEEECRREALRVGAGADGSRPATWIALAAGWSGGSIAPAEFGYVAAPPVQTPKAVRAALLMALSHVPAEAAASRVGPCLEHALALAHGSAGDEG